MLAERGYTMGFSRRVCACGMGTSSRTGTCANCARNRDVKTVRWGKSGTHALGIAINVTLKGQTLCGIRLPYSSTSEGLELGLGRPSCEMCRGKIAKLPLDTITAQGVNVSANN